MRFSARSYAESLLKLAETATKKEIPEIVDQFIAFLVKERQFTLARQIIEHVENMVREGDGRVKVTVEGVHAMDEQTRKYVADFLRKPAESIDFEENVDENLVGGMRIRLNDLLVDATITGQLEKLRQSLR